ncbi:toxin [Cytobacillus depressus]|uniref:Toxin n=1 Tax=Cytobacillus depressus TaxID=1602942 RepID=A0A6L3VBP6_9BACI|nr:toxin [Cytobacillus depressus]KAB2338187.1 toxin [Cytobacillus depressus]
MKRMQSLFILMALSLSSLGSSQAEMGGIQLKDYPRNSLLYQNLTLASSALLEKIIVLPLGSFDELEAAGIIERVDHLPYFILEKMVNENIKLKLFVGQLTENPTVKDLTGVIPRGYTNNTTWDDVPGIGGSKTVLVKIGYSEKGKGHGSVNLELHELAHSIDKYVYEGIRFNQEFLSIWNKEKEALFPNQDYFLNFPEEYFAEAFAMYYLGSHTRMILKERASETYRFIQKLN